jgi:hypothetical protein
MNRYGICKLLEEEVKARDRDCVYCGVTLTEPSPENDKKRNGTRKHINNDKWDDEKIMEFNVVRCSTVCNSSKGAKSLRDWLDSPYCVKRKIDQKMAPVVKRFLRMFSE